MRKVLSEIIESKTVKVILKKYRFNPAKDDIGDNKWNKLYDELFDYYADTGEMPYGTMKARTGDPYIWIQNRIENIK